MKTSLVCAPLFLAVLSAAVAEPIHAPSASAEAVAWCDVWIPHANESGLPRVLLLGDSISQGYYAAVEKSLAGRAYVAKLATSAFISDPALMQQVVMVLDQYHFDIIHFNNGMHGWEHSEAEYRAAFPQFLATLQQHAPQARLVWASTTTLKVSPHDPAHATDQRIAARNATALEFVQPAHIDVDDLAALTAGHPELHIDNVHFNSDGTALQAKQVTAAIVKLLPVRD
ncbi:MAG TPA: SGNH/GDSL hydrolase family protein [Verrucomicrobiae bacterium]|nr:SGNH/GDSL hydrolase family protein [Verrucomicrobiae bacterium]